MSESNNLLIMQQDNAKGSTALQAQVVNVYPNGITEEKCREIFMDLYKTNVLSLRDEAKDVACQRAEQLTDIFIQKLSKQDDEIRKKIEDQLKDPAMQEAIFKSQKCFAMSNDDDHLKILTDMLIDRGSISQRTNKQMLIDEAIDVLPRLNKKHLDILLFYLTLQFEHSLYDENIIKNFINEIITRLESILPLKKDDPNLQYLSQKQCLVAYNALQHVISPIEIVVKRTRLLNFGFSKEEYDRVIAIKIPEIIFKNSITNPGNVVIDMSLDELNNILKSKNLPKEKADDIIHFWHRNKNENDSKLIQDFIIKNFENGNILFNKWTNIINYNVSVLGIMIACVYAKTRFQYSINWEFE